MSKEITEERLYWYVWMTLHQLRDILTQFRSEELAQYGITVAQAGILTSLSIYGESTIDSLSKLLLRKHHTISTALTRMAEKGLINKNKKERSDNKYGITLTEKGKRACEEAQRGESIHELMSCLSREELEQLSTLLKKIWVKAMEVDISKRGFPLSEYSF